MKYLVIDAAPGTNGIRDKFSGNYLSPEELGLNPGIRELLQSWLLKYEAEYFGDYIHA
jgi:hypothetical protein